jgi:hypothetical protein
MAQLPFKPNPLENHHPNHFQDNNAPLRRFIRSSDSIGLVPLKRKKHQKKPASRL